MAGTKQSFCVAEKSSALWTMVGTAAGGAAAVAVLALAARGLRRRKTRRKKRK